MFERFTDRARKALQHAQAEANRLNHMYVGTQHVLLGLIKEESGIAGTVLLRLGCDLAKARSAVHQVTPSKAYCVTFGRLPRSSNANMLIEYAIQIAKASTDDFVGTEHLLLGLLRVPNCTGLAALYELGVQPETVRADVARYRDAVLPHRLLRQLEAAPTLQSLVAAVQAVELAAATEADTATQLALQLAAEIIRQRVEAQQEELVVPLPNGRIRAGCDDWSDPDAIQGDYLAVDITDGETVVVTAADLVCQSAQVMTRSVAAVVQALHLAGGDDAVVRPAATTPPVHLLRWSIYHFVRWLSVAAIMRGVPCNNSNWTDLTGNGPKSSPTTES